ncbi:MAG: hypothetical protein ACFWTN_04485 [Clostridium sp.]|jgi:AraC-like DNA-binding protein
MDVLYDLKELQSLLVNIYTLTKFRVAIFDENYKEILAYPTRLTDFCRTLRCDDKLNEKCKSCDFRAFQKCRNLKKEIIYQCHAGLTEAIAPIRSPSIIVGYIMFGQVLTDDTPMNTWDKMYSYLKDYKLDFELLKSNYDHKQIVSSDVIRSAAKIIDISASYLLHTQKVRLAEDSLAYKIDNYILNHLNDPLDAQCLCEHFHYKKTNFYKMTTAMFGVGIAKHIRQLRIQKAKEYLLNSDLPIYKIASLVGIEDYNYFTKVFKQETKCTPREFRKNNFVSCGRQ